MNDCIGRSNQNKNETITTMKLTASSLLMLYAALPSVGAFVLPQSSQSAFGTSTRLHSTIPGPPPPGAGTQSVTKAASTPTGGGAPAAPLAGPGGGVQKVKDIWDSKSAVRVQGQSLRTWSFESVKVNSVQVFLKTDGRPLNANVELWQGPDNTPQRVGVYIEDGEVRPFNCVIETPRDSNAIAVYNTNPLEYPLDACVEADTSSAGIDSFTEGLAEKTRIVQGGAIYTQPFDPSVQSVQILITTDGRPLNSRVELLQGPNNQKQVMEIYTEDGLERPLFAVLDTPGVGNVVRIVNTATVEFPLAAAVEPYIVESW